MKRALIPMLLIAMTLMTAVAAPAARADVSLSTMILVNKENPLPSDYVPEDLTVCNVRFAGGVEYSRKQMRREAAEALERMFDAAEEDGIELLGVSGYRSYWTQNELYQAGLARSGPEHVALYIAPPGCSEHQTGLAMDVGVAGCTDLTERFAQTDAYRWLRRHAHEYGFIVRYPRGRTNETGYAFEPWHVRYLGEASKDVWRSGLTLERWYAHQLDGTTLHQDFMFLSAQVES